MKRFFAVLAAAMSVGVLGGMFSGGAVLAQARQDDSGRNTVQPWQIARPQPSTPPAQRGPVQTPTMQEWRPSVVPYAVYPYGSYVPGYWYGYSYAYPYPYYPTYYLPPLYLPAETLYGPEAAKRFLGVDPRTAMGGGAGSGTAPGERTTREERSLSLRGTNRDSLALAGKFIGYGDNHFAKHRYNDANQRYKKAAEIAPGLADAHFRQGYALAAMGRYEAAVRAIQRGLDLDPNWARSDFRSSDLYRDDQAAKTAHLDALAKAATAAPRDPDLLFLLGVLLYFDGQADRASTFFRRADQLASGPHLKGFLEQGKKKD